MKFTFTIFNEYTRVMQQQHIRYSIWMDGRISRRESGFFCCFYCIYCWVLFGVKLLYYNNNNDYDDESRCE